MIKLEDFIDEKNSAKEIVVFKDGRMAPKNESIVYEIIKLIFLIWMIILVLGSVLFKEFLLSGESIPVLICFFIVIGYLVKYGGHERVECISELHFFDDYLIFYVPKHHVKRSKNQLEIQKIYYRDIKKCLYRTVIRKIQFFGMIEHTIYKYDKYGNLNEIPEYHRFYDGMIKFYSVFDYEHDFIDIIERNIPIKVEHQNS